MQTPSVWWRSQQILGDTRSREPKILLRLPNRTAEDGVESRVSWPVSFAKNTFFFFSSPNTEAFPAHNLIVYQITMSTWSSPNLNFSEQASTWSTGSLSKSKVCAISLSSSCQIRLWWGSSQISKPLKQATLIDWNYRRTISRKTKSELSWSRGWDLWTNGWSGLRTSRSTTSLGKLERAPKPKCTRYRGKCDSLYQMSPVMNSRHHPTFLQLKLLTRTNCSRGRKPTKSRWLMRSKYKGS